ncbi:MAG: transglutaminase domain-containing protein [Candidatus Pacearchaeota archaeon]
MKNQLELTDRLRNIADSVQGEGLELAIKLKDIVYQLLEFRPYDEKTKDHEHNIRWKRTADQILKDGYVYDGKACTDVVVAYLGLARAKGFDTRFVKVFRSDVIHSIAEIFVDNEWYIYDVASRNSQPQKGEYQKGIPINGWTLWKKGRDAWDLELEEYKDVNKIRFTTK